MVPNASLKDSRWHLNSLDRSPSPSILVQKHLDLNPYTPFRSLRPPWQSHTFHTRTATASQAAIHPQTRPFWQSACQPSALSTSLGQPLSILSLIEFHSPPWFSLWFAYWIRFYVFLILFGHLLAKSPASAILFAVKGNPFAIKHFSLAFLAWA